MVLQAEGDDRIFVQRGGQGQLSVRVRGEDGGGIILQQDILVNPAPDDAAFLREQLIADPVFHAVFDGAEVRTDGAYQPGTVIKRVVSDFGQAAGQGDNARVRFAEGLVSDLRQGAGQGDLRQRPAVVEGLFADDGDAFFQHNAPQACTGAEGLFLHGIHAAGNGHGGEPGSGEGELSEVVQVFRQGNSGQFSAVHERVVPEEGQVCRKGDGSKIFTVLEGAVPDKQDAVRNRDLRQAGAVLERADADVLKALRKLDAAEAPAVPERAGFDLGYALSEGDGSKVFAAPEGVFADDRHAVRDRHTGAAADNALVLLQAGSFVQLLCFIRVIQADSGDGMPVQFGRDDQDVLRFRGENGGGIVLQQDILVIPAPGDAVAGRVNGIPDAV